MRHFTSVEDAEDIESLIKESELLKAHPMGFAELGQGKTLGLIFFNPSLRTRLSTQRAAQLLGLSVIVMNINADSWKLEFEDGVVMNEEKAEHIKDAAAVMGQYCQIIGIRAFARLEDRDEDYEERIQKAFMRYAGVPIISLESATRHPLQSLADLITIHEYKLQALPKIVLTWAPHPKALPQAVANSFSEWMIAAGMNLTITHPKGYELDPGFTNGAKIEYDQTKAFQGADFIYAKNWSSYHKYGQTVPVAENWMINEEKMALTRNAHFMHCLPVRRNVITTDQVIDSSNSLVIPQAANRVVATQLVLKRILERL